MLPGQCQNERTKTVSEASCSSDAVPFHCLRHPVTQMCKQGLCVLSIVCTSHHERVSSSLHHQLRQGSKCTCQVCISLSSDHSLLHAFPNMFVHRYPLIILALGKPTTSPSTRREIGWQPHSLPRTQGLHQPSSTP